MSKTVKPPRSFIIRNKKTGEVWVSHNGKKIWTTTGTAKAAWHYSNTRYTHLSNIKSHCKMLEVLPVRDRWGDLAFPKIDEQGTWEVVEIGLEAKDTLDEAKKLLRLCLGRITDSYIENKVIKFLEEHNAE